MHRSAFLFRCLSVSLFSALLPSCMTTGGGTAAGPATPQGPQLAGLASYVVVDTHDKKVVMSSASGQRLPLGSLSKIATGVVALDAVAALGHSLDERMVINPSAVVAGTSSVGLQAGDSLSVRDALYATLMADDNLAAEAVAEHVGAVILQKTGQGGTPLGAFVGQMNALAANHNMSSTRFANPHGLNSPNGTNISTASDAARLAIFANSRGAFNFFVNQRSRRISLGGRSLAVTNTNRLLGDNRVDGLHIGASGPAGGSFAITAGRQATQSVGQDGRVYVTPNRLITVGLGSQDPAGHASQLLQGGWGAYLAWQAGGRVLGQGEELLR